MCSNNCVSVIELDYVVLKLNGSDITSLSNCEAVQMFLQAKENLIVELFRKKTPTENTNDVRGINPSEEAATCGKFQENIEILNAKETCASTNINSNSNNAYASQKKSKIVLTLRAIINSDHNVPALDDIDIPPNAQSKETQTIEDYQLHVPDNRRNENIVQTIADHFIEQEHHLFEHCLEPEIDIEEVTLIKEDSTSSEPLGITVCGNEFFKEYDEGFKPVISTTEDADNEANLEENVFISEIHAESIAEKDGRLRRGDQVLRINGIDIKSKRHAETMITENGAPVTLLVSRILYPDEEDENDDDVDDDDEDDDEDDDIDSNFVYANRFLSDDYTNVVDKLEKVLLAQQHAMPAANKSHIETKPPPETLAEVNKSKSILKAQSETVSNQLAAVTRVPPINPANSKQQYDYDDSEHIYETIPEDSESEPLYCSPYQSSNYITACSSADVFKMQQQTQRVAQWLGIKHQQITSRTAHTLAGRPSVYNKHIQQQRLSTNRVCTLRSAITTNTSRSSSSGGAGHNNLDTDIINNQNHNLNHNQLHEEVENSSSAYNTGGSNNSASPRQNLNLDNDTFSTTTTTTPKTQTAKETFLISPVNSRILYPTSSSALNHIYAQENPAVQNKVTCDAVQPGTASAAVKPESKQLRAKLVEEQQAQCPQFNAPNLSRYHFVSSKEAANKRMSGATSSSVFVNHDNAEEVPMVWKVKRRPDGSRYIVKRPARSHVNQVEIRRNVEKIKQDDDVMADLKLARYWTKEERRRHIERAREKRQLQHQVQPQQQQ